MAKLSPTQAKLLEKLTRDLATIKKYSDYEDFFNNSAYEQNILTTAAHCNSLYNTKEKIMSREFKCWEDGKLNYSDAVNENALIVYAKTETINALERAGCIQIIKKLVSNIRAVRKL